MATRLQDSPVGGATGRIAAIVAATFALSACAAVLSINEGSGADASSTDGSLGEDGSAEDGGACDDPCSEAGAIRCVAGGAMQACNSSNSCLAWSAPVACGEGSVCCDGGS